MSNLKCIIKLCKCINKNNYNATIITISTLFYLFYQEMFTSLAYNLFVILLRVAGELYLVGQAIFVGNK